MMATMRYNRVVKGEEEEPTPAWLKRYFPGVYQAWDRKDLLWAVFSYFFWKAHERTDEGFEQALYDLMEVANCGQKQRHEIATFFGVTSRSAISPIGSVKSSSRSFKSPVSRLVSMSSSRKLSSVFGATFKSTRRREVPEDEDEARMPPALSPNASLSPKALLLTSFQDKLLLMNEA
jgi:hypothetical protein